VIGRGYGQHWPPRSPDLSPLDYWLWGTLKARVYHNNKPATLEELQEKICEEMDKLTQAEIEKAIAHLIFRLELVVDEKGGVLEQLL
jgi:NAD dependent epimerase/dehydratase family enzyme